MEGERKVSIERKVVFNPKDKLTPNVKLPINLLAEGEMGGNIQNISGNILSNKTSNNNQNMENALENPKKDHIPTEQVEMPLNDSPHHDLGQSEPLV